jgi:hypothetical protein
LVVAAALVVCSVRVRAVDEVRAETGVDQAVSTFGVSGRGILVAIMDRGIDWTNNDFRNADGTTRIKYIFDLTDDTGANDLANPYGEGTIYTEAQINSALTGGPTLATRDAVGHGTASAGIAGGNGSNSPNRLYRGMAPEASLIIVKITSDGAPAHDSQPAEAPFYDPARIPVAIDFIRDKAAELHMPCVMLLNLGSIGGPTDGTSDLCRKIDATVGPGIPGLVFVTGTGDDGGMANHAGGTVTAGGDTPIQIQKGEDVPLFFDLWYDGSDRFDVTIQTPDGLFGPYASPATNDDYDIQSETDFLYYQLGVNRHFYNAANTKREIWIRLDGPTGNYTITLHGATVSNGRFDASLNPSQVWNDSNANFFLNNVVPGYSIWDGASALYNIAPNCYVMRTSWVDIDGFTRTLTGQGNVGEIWTGSNIGPTYDGRLGVDVSAPGEEIVTSYNPNSYWATFRFNLIQGGNGLYGMAGAVSAAAPVTTGIIALMLQRNPNLDAAQVKHLLQETAKQDAFTGATPNTTWGYGKINAFGAVQAAGTNTLLQLPDVAGLGGQKVLLRAAIRRYSDGQFLVGQTVTFQVDGTTVGTAVTQSNYIASLNYTIPASLTPGVHTLSASFAGDVNYNASSRNATLTVHDNTLLQLPPVSGVAGQSVLLRAAVRRYPDGVFLAGKTVTFKIDGTTVGSAVTQSNFIASLNYTIPASLGPGSHTLTASFAGDSDYNACTQTSTLIASYNTLVQLPNVSGSAGKSVLLRAAIRRYPDGQFLAGQTVTFRVDGTTVGSAVTQSDFIASLSYTIPANLSNGAHTLKAIFAGGGGYNASSQTATLTVNP